MTPATQSHPALIAGVAGALTGCLLVYLYVERSNSLTSDRQPPRSRRPRLDGAQSEEFQARSLEASALEPNERELLGAAVHDAAIVYHPDTPGGPLEDDNVTENDLSENDEESLDGRHPGQHLKQLAYAIARHNAETESIVHRYVTCDGCGQQPIRGVRYKCANCPDFDLCEQCEAEANHLQTHVFYKIKIPVPIVLTRPTAVWYPGRPKQMPDELSEEMSGLLTARIVAEISARKVVPNGDTIQALYRQFTCLANTRYEEDSLGLGYGIDIATFKQLRPTPKSNSLLLEQAFRFYDTHDHGILGFIECVIGGLISQDSDAYPNIYNRRVFRCLDADRDGYLSRKDLLRTCRANHQLNMAIIQRTVDNEQEGESAEHVRSGRDPRSYVEGPGSLGAYFDTPDPVRFEPNARRHESKAISGYGDRVPTNDANENVLLDTRRVPIAREDASSSGSDFGMIEDFSLQAFNRMLDPIFSPRERLAEAASVTTEIRANYPSAIKIAIDALTRIAPKAVEMGTPFTELPRDPIGPGLQGEVRWEMMVSLRASFRGGQGWEPFMKKLWDLGQLHEEAWIDYWSQEQLDEAVNEAWEPQEASAADDSDTDIPRLSMGKLERSTETMMLLLMECERLATKQKGRAGVAYEKLSFEEWFGPEALDAKTAVMAWAGEVLRYVVF